MVYLVNGKKDYGSIEDSLRIAILNNAINKSVFTSALTKRFILKIQKFRNSLEDPINLGFLLSQNTIGNDLIKITTKRGWLNVFYKYYQDGDDISDAMSEKDIIKYHTNRIHLVNDSTAFYKSIDKELTLSRDENYFYFKFIKDFTKEKWLLDDVIVCSKEEEEQFDLKLIGKPSPLKYYEAEVYDYEESE